MARKPSRSQAAAARKAARIETMPIRFVADYDHVTPNVTTSYKTGMVLQAPKDVREAALAKGKAVVDAD